MYLLRGQSSGMWGSDAPEYATIKGWNEWKTQFKEFQESKGKLNWEDVNMKVYRSIISYCNDKGYSENSTGKQIKYLKTILRKGYEQELHSNEIFRNKKFKTLTSEIDKFTLSEEEVEKIYNLDFSNNNLMDLHRDVFLIGCFTALRLSDIKRINPSNIVKEGKVKFISMRTLKTDRPVKIPISTRAKKILTKYNFEIPKVTETYLNKDIKAICKLAGIVEMVEVKTTKGGETKYIKKHKYNVITSHSARRACATLMYQNGMDTFQIRQITGHKKESSLLKYINISKDKIAERIAKNPFFK